MKKKEVDNWCWNGMNIFALVGVIQGGSVIRDPLGASEEDSES